MQTDKKRLQQVLLNVMQNSVKYSLQNGQITINAQLLREQIGEEKLQIEIKDTGVGMSEMDVQNLFDI